ncbi:MAG: type II CAAX endopeptidase family protein [Chloroflexota bacterium]|nr:CPBP family intramembrane metalloprotease [Dehalococcoidia bacterium]MDW8252347.1 type II CAAX endopeptidase family protein [Chloroflexota bacterium]
MDVERSPVPWGIGDILGAIAAAIALVILIVGGAFAVLALLRPVIDVAPFARPVSIGAITAAQLGLLGIALAFAARRGGLAALGFRRFPPDALLAAAGLLLAGLIIQLAYGLALQALGLGQENPQRIDVLVGATPLSLAIALLSGAVITPIAEETFFRGFILPGLVGRLGTAGAVTVSSALFAVAHLVPQVMLPTFLLGILLALLRLWSGSLWPPILLHASFNALALLAVYTATRALAAL